MFSAACWVLLVVSLAVVKSSVVLPEYEVRTFTAGIKYDSSIPMSAGTDRFRHRGITEPFSVSVSTTSRSDYVIDYLEVSVTTDAGADVTFCVVQGQPGSKSLLFQITSNGSDFLQYAYRTYGLWAEEYAKVTASYAVKPVC